MAFQAVDGTEGRSDLVIASRARRSGSDAIANLNVRSRKVWEDITRKGIAGAHSANFSAATRAFGDRNNQRQ